MLGPDAARRVADFVLARRRGDGGFAGRSEGSDLYYTHFALLCLAALGVPLPASAAGYVDAFGAADALDLVHLACLARCRRLLDMPPDEADIAIARRVATFRRGDGGYHTEAAARCSSAYGCLLALGALQDLRAAPDAAAMAAVLARMRVRGGGFGNTPDSPLATTPATAAAVVTLRHLHRPAPGPAVRWLLGRFSCDGGFRAAAGSPAPDLLATAVALHALSACGADLAGLREKCLDYLNSLWSPGGAFRAHWADKDLDVEYAFYGLLATGTLALK
jgi:prenyltransferase beta subunit